MDPICVSIAEACKLLGIGRTKAYQLLHSQSLESICVGRRRLVKLRSIYRLVEQSRSPTDSQE